MSRVFLIVLAVLLSGLSGCRPEVLSEQELHAYITEEGNGLTQKVTKGAYALQLTYRPTDLLVAQEIGSRSSYSTALIDSLRQRYGRYAYFILNISREDQEVLQAYRGTDGFYDLLQNLAFRMDQHAFLTTSAKDTVPVADFVYPRLYGASQSTTLMLVFSREDFGAAEYLDFHLKDVGLGVGLTRFRFEREALEQAPRVKF